MKPEKITDLEQVICRDYGNIAGIVIQKNAHTVYEGYFNGYTAERHLHIFSITKSVVSILIGIAIDKGYINNIDQKVLDFFPDYKVKRGEKTIQRITIRDIITMTAPYKYKSAPYTKYFTSESWVKTALDLLGGKGEVGRFRYTPLIGPDILTGILTSATHDTLLDFAHENLFAPLGIKVEDNIVFKSKEEQIAIMTKDCDISGWVADPQGINTAGWGLFLTPTDMAKLGQLYLNHGVCNGKQLVSAEWIDDSTRQHSYWAELELKYGYLWWVIDEKEHSFAAMGDGGNVIYVNPAKDMVIAIASRFMPRPKDRINLIKEVLEPMFENQK